MPADLKIINYVTAFAPYCRKRHEHHRRKNEIIKFVVQLEILANGAWHPIIRYDTAHGYAHCDIIDHRGKIQKIRIPGLDYNEALTYADKDISQNWQTYCDHYFKERPYEQR